MNTLTAAITEKVVLGHPITFTATLTRTKNGVHRTWVETPHKERQGIIVGTRTLWDGEMYSERLDEEDGGGYVTFFTPYHMHISAFLVSYALNRKPVLVLQSNAVAR
jgi:hypothetical protein